MTVVPHAFVLILAALWPMHALADALPVKVIPHMLLLEGDEGDRIGDAITVINDGQQPVLLRMEAVNWVMGEGGIPEYGSGASPMGDCRSWWSGDVVDLLVPPGASREQMIEIQVPEPVDKEMECRFALQFSVPADSVSVSRLYTPVYVRVEGAEPELKLESLGLVSESSGKTPVAMIRNMGTAHATVHGFLQGEDAQGQQLDLIARPTQILPGETRGVRLLVSRRGGGETWWSPPLTIEGTLIWAEDDMDIEGVLR